MLLQVDSERRWLRLAPGRIGHLFPRLPTEQQARSLSGVLLGIWAFGSLIAAFVVGAVPPKRSSIDRFRWGTVGLTLAATPMMFVEHLGVLAVLLLLAGFAISPTMIARVAVVEQTVPQSRLGEGMAWTNSTMTAGVALGSAVAGQVVDHAGASVAFTVPVLSGAFAMLVAWLLPGLLPAGRSGHRTSDPVTTGCPSKQHTAHDSGLR